MTTRRDLFKKLFAGALAALGVAKAENPLICRGKLCNPSKAAERVQTIGIRGRRSISLNCIHDLELGPLYAFSGLGQNGLWRISSKRCGFLLALTSDQPTRTTPIFEYEFVEAPSIVYNSWIQS